jgi:prolyl oligopeptidase
MCPLISPPFSALRPVTEILHGVTITDPYRWLEKQDSPGTRAWIAEQTRYARTYIDSIPGRERIRERVRQLLDVETCDSFLKTGPRYFFRKRLPGQEQPCIYLRDGAEGEDQLLVDPSARGVGPYTAVKPIQVSPDGKLLLFEVKRGGERSGTFEILDMPSRKILPDALPHGCLRGFAFAPDSGSFYYSLEATAAKKPFYRAAFKHVLGTDRTSDREIFCAGEDEKLRLVLVSGGRTLGFLIYRFAAKTYTSFYLWGMGSSRQAIPIVRDADYRFSPRILPGRILAVIDQEALNRRIVDVQPRKDQNPIYFDLVSEADAMIHAWTLTASYVAVSYVRGSRSEIAIFDQFGRSLGEIPCAGGCTVRVAAASSDDDDLLVERESFTEPIELVRYVHRNGATYTWAKRNVPFEAAPYTQTRECFPSRDGTNIPMFLAGRTDVLAGGCHPTIMTAYGGHGVCMTPQFSVLVAFLLERGCLFALPNIRGGSEFGASWHRAAVRHNRQTAYDDFLSAVDCLVTTGRTSPDKLGIFGGSNSGLLVAVALTQRPCLFRAALCIAPILDMLRYHLFDKAHIWIDEYGSPDDSEDFAVLRRYSPYHQVQDGTPYPATLIVSGDADGTCNPSHARKMTARLQAATASGRPVLIDYNEFRGHAPVLHLSARVDGLTDRLAFLCEQLQIPV